MPAQLTSAETAANRAANASTAFSSVTSSRTNSRFGRPLGLLIEAAADDPIARRRKLFRARPTDAGTAAGDDGYLFHGTSFRPSRSSASISGNAALIVWNASSDAGPPQ